MFKVLEERNNAKTAAIDMVKLRLGSSIKNIEASIKEKESLLQKNENGWTKFQQDDLQSEIDYLKADLKDEKIFKSKIQNKTLLISKKGSKEQKINSF